MAPPSFEKDPTKYLLSAVIEASPNSLRRAGALNEGSTPHLTSATSKLAEILEIDPDSQIAHRVRDLLLEERMFYVVGPWPPTQADQTPTGGAIPAPKFCSQCGKPLP